MKIWHLVFRPDSLTYTIAKALSYGGHDVIVWVADPEHRQRPPTYAQTRLPRTPGVRIVSNGEFALPPVIDRLIIQVFPRPADALAAANRLALLAKRISVVSAGDRSQPWGGAMTRQWLEARKLAAHATKIDRVLYKDGFYPRDLHGLFRTRHALGFDVHSQFLDDEDSFRAIHARDWDPETRRDVLANFLGSRDPDIRTRILDSVRSLFRSDDGGTGTLNTDKSMYWLEYSDDAPAALGPGEFVDVLSRSDFTLCPRGYSMVTHRPMEALLRGSIPVLSAHDLDLYGIPA